MLPLSFPKPFLTFGHLVVLDHSARHAMIFDKVVRYFSANTGQQLAGRGGKQHQHHHVNKIQKTNATTMATNTSTILQVPNQASIPTSSTTKHFISQSSWHQRMIISRATHYKLRHPPPIQHRGLQRTIHLKNMLKRLQQEDLNEDNVPLASIQL